MRTIDCTEKAVTTPLQKPGIGMLKGSHSVMSSLWHLQRNDSGFRSCNGIVSYVLLDFNADYRLHRKGSDYSTAEAWNRHVERQPLSNGLALALCSVTPQLSSRSCQRS